jgi:hypothetical protein
VHFIEGTTGPVETAEVLPAGTGKNRLRTRYPFAAAHGRRVEHSRVVAAH